MPARFSIDEAFLLKEFESPANVDRLAQDLKNRRVRDCLRDRGFKFLVPGDEFTPENKRLGFYSLPRELRDKVCKYAIDLKREDWRTPAIAHLACVDSEWRDDVEAVTFQSLGSRSKLPNLSDPPLFEKYLVGKRRQHLNRLEITLQRLKISLIVGRPEWNTYIEQRAINLTSCLGDIFTILGKWDKKDSGNGSLKVRISIRPDIPLYLYPEGFNLELARLMNELPTVPAITGFGVPDPNTGGLGEEMDTRALFSLLSRMPKLRSTDVEFRDSGCTVPMDNSLYTSNHDANAQGKPHLTAPKI